MGKINNELNSFGQIFREISLFGFSPNWKGTSNSWELDDRHGVSDSNRELLEQCIFSLNKVDRESSYQSLIISSQFIHCNYFIVDLSNFEEYICVGIVTTYDRGSRPSSLECRVYLKDDLSRMKNCMKYILEGLPNRVSDPDIPVTRREQDILELIAEGKSQKQIAAILSISNSTVESHKARLFSKFQVRSSAELISKAFLSKSN